MPFGLPPPPPATPPPAAAPPPPPPPPFATKLTLCAINRTPMGSLAVGFTDASQNPIHSYYLDVGETQDGFTVVSADFDQECTTIEKGGVSVDLKMGKGATVATAKPTPVKPQPIAVTTPPPAPPVVPDATTPAAEPPAAGRIQRPSQAGLPPMPGVPPMQLAEGQILREDIAKLKETGGDVASYMRQLRERKAQEKEAKAAAEATARKAIQELANKLSAAEVAKREREINLSLIEQGAQPVSDINLTAEEEKALVEKGVLP
jgi:hypothetical protein